MDCTTTGCAEPIGTEATCVVTVVRRLIRFIGLNIWQGTETAEGRELWLAWSSTCGIRAIEQVRTPPAISTALSPVHVSP